MKRVGFVSVRRSLDGVERRAPLRLKIGRRVARTRAGKEKFVTQIRMGEMTAVMVPWRERGDAPAGAPLEGVA